MPARTCFNSDCYFCLHNEVRLLSKEVHNLLIVLLVLFSVYITGVCVIFIVLFKVSQMLSPGCYHREVTFICLPREQLAQKTPGSDL